MWGPSDAEWKSFIITAVVILLIVGATLGGGIVWALS
jgi:nitrate reductase NapE component